MAGFSLGRSPDTLPTSDTTPDVPSYTRGFELWQHHHLFPSSHSHSHSNLLSFSHDPQLLPSAAVHHSTRAMRGAGGAGGINCQDCGNQAKKDCSHLRCRTCCKSRGFQCSTHVKSTWVPAAKRRERQQQLAATAALQQSQRQQQQQQHRSGGVGVLQDVGVGGSESSKRPRELMLHSSNSRLVTALATTSAEGMEASVAFPAEVSSPAVFRCICVSPMDEADDEYAYQAAVTIGGHLFKGILYDHGPEGSGMSPSPRQHAESTSSAAATAVTTSAAAVTTAAVASQASLLDPTSLYPAPLSAFMAGTQFFPQNPRP